MLMRKLLFLICVLGMPCASWAQSNSASWENLNTLQAGEKIQVLEMNSKNISGTFVNVSDVAISLQDKTSQEMVQRQDVRSVKLMKSQNRLRNGLIGAAVGAGVGAGIGAASCHGSGDNCFFWERYFCRDRRCVRFRAWGSRRSPGA